MTTMAPNSKHRFGKLAIAMVMGAGLVGALAPSALAQDSSESGNNSPATEGRPHPQLTDAQKACLEQHGVQKPQPGPNGERPQLTDAQRQALRTAAQACGVQLPLRRHPRPRLTDAQKTCLQEHGVQKPAVGANGERPKPTDAQRQAFREAADACGIKLPDRPNTNDNTPDNNSGSDTSTAS
jgi:hypothetical protein